MQKLYYSFQNILWSLIILSGVLNNFINVYLYEFSFSFVVVFVVTIDIIYNLLSLKKIKIPKNYFKFFLIVLGFYAVILLSLIYSPSPKYKYIKSANFIVSIIYLIYPFFIRKIDIKKALFLIKFVGLFLSLFYIYQRYNYFLPSNVGRDTFYAKHRQLSVAYLGLGVLISITLLHESFKKNWIQVLLLLFLIIALGSRGSFVFSIIVLLLFHFKKKYSIKKWFSNGLSFIIIGLVIPIFLFYFDIKKYNIASAGISRFNSFLNILNDASVLGRIDYYTYTTKMIFSSLNSILFGYGIGSYGVLYVNIDVRKYPHNIFLESWFELGIIGFVLMILIILIPFFINSKSLLLKAIYFFLVLSAMKTGNITDLWTLFLTIGLMYMNQENTDYFNFKNILFVKNK